MASKAHVLAIGGRVLETALWIILCPLIGTAVFSLFTEYRGGSTTAGLSNRSEFEAMLILLFRAWLSTPPLAHIIGFGLLVSCIWALGDLPISALIKRIARPRTQESIWPELGETYDSFVVKSILKRARHARSTANWILVLMVGTLIVGMWVFVSAPGAESSRNIAVKRSAADIAFASGSLNDLLTDFKRFAGAQMPDDSLLVDLTAVEQSVVQSAKIIDEAAKVVSDAIRSQTPEPILTQSAVTRLGAIVILLVALKVLSTLYRANSRLAQQYAARADGILLALHRGAKKLDGDDVIEAGNRLVPIVESADTISTPLDMAGRLTEKLADLTGKAGEWTGKATDLVKALKAKQASGE